MVITKNNLILFITTVILCLTSIPRAQAGFHWGLGRAASVESAKPIQRENKKQQLNQINQQTEQEQAEEEEEADPEPGPNPAPHHLALLGGNSVQTNHCLTLYLQSHDADNTRCNVAYNTMVDLNDGAGSGSFYLSSADCASQTNAAESAALTVNTSQTTLFYRNNTPESVTLSAIDRTNNGQDLSQSNGSLEVTISQEPANRLTLTGSQNIYIGDCTEYTLQAEDSADTVQTLELSSVIDLSDNNSAGQFYEGNGACLNGTPTIDSVTIYQNQSQATFTYRSFTPETPVLTAVDRANDGQDLSQTNGTITVTVSSPVIKNLGVVIDRYDADTGLAGNLVLNPIDRRPFIEFGYTESGRTFPAFEYYVTTYTVVTCVADAIVTHVNYQASPGDYEIHTQFNADTSWIVEYDHILNPQVTEGQTIRAGDPIGLAGVGPSAQVGRTEIMIFLGGVRPLSYCPLMIFDPTQIETAKQQISDLMSDYETLKGDPSLYNESTMLVPGCHSVNFSD